MRILLVGIGYRDYPTIYATVLREMGHDVDLYVGLRQFDLVTRLHRIVRVRVPNLFGAGRDYLHSEQMRLRRFLRRAGRTYDLALFVNADRLVTDDILAESHHKFALTGLWLLDDKGTIPNSGLDFRSFDLLASFNESEASSLSASLMRDVRFVPQGFAPIQPDGQAPWSERPLFVGAPYPSRREAALAVRAAGIPIEVVGRMWPSWFDEAADLTLTGDVTLERTIGMSRDGRVCVNGHRAADTGVSPRVFEIAGAGGLLISDNVHAPRFFEPGVEMFHWATPEEAADHVLRAMREPRRAAEIARRAHDRVRAEHTIRQRFTALFEAWGID